MAVLIFAGGSMTRNRCKFLALTALVFALSSCSDYLSPVKGYLELYTEDAFIYGHEITTVFEVDGDGVDSVPSANPATLQFWLRNPNQYRVAASLRFDDAAVEASRTESNCSLTINYSRTGIFLDLSAELLLLHERGGNLSGTIILAEEETGRSFPSYHFSLRSNTPPPVPVGSRIMVDSANNYVVCFNLDLSDAIHDDLVRITLNDTVYTVSSVITGNGQTIVFTDAAASTAEPAGGLTALPTLEPFAPASGMTPVYISTGYSSVAESYKEYTISVYDVLGLSQTILTTTLGDKLPPVSVSHTGTSLLDGSYSEIVAEASGTAPIVLTNPQTGSTVHYLVVSDGVPQPEVTFTTNSQIVDLPDGVHQIQAWATQNGYIDSDLTTVSLVVSRLSAVYVHNTNGDDSNSGNYASPCRTISGAFAKFGNPDDPNNTIVLQSDITGLDGAGQLAHLDIASKTQLTIDGQGLYAIDATTLPGNRGMYVAGSGELDLTLRGLAIRNVIWYNQNGAGFYISNDNARVIFDDCSVNNNQMFSANANGAGIYCRANSLDLRGTNVTGNVLTGSGSCQGGGVYFYGDNFTVANGSISQNTMDDGGSNSNLSGAGFYAEQRFGITMIVTMMDVDVEANRVTGSSGTGFRAYGVGGYITAGSSELERVNFRGNSIAPTSSGIRGYGAGLYLANGSHTLTSCEISNNSIINVAEASGAGIFLSTMINLTLETTSITGNYGTATNGYGGAIFMGDRTTAIMTGGQITGNSANTSATGLNDSQGDGVFANVAGTNSATFTLNSGDISENQSPATGTPTTNTAFYLGGEFALLVLDPSVTIPDSNVVYLENDAQILADYFFTNDHVATLKYPNSAATGDPCLKTTSTSLAYCRPAANYYKFTVEDISGNPYCINAAGKLSEISVSPVNNMTDFIDEITNAPTDGTTVLIELAGGTYQINNTIQFPTDTNIRIIPQGDVEFDIQGGGDYFNIFGNLLFGGNPEITVDCQYSTVERSERLFIVNSSLVARRVGVRDSGVYPGNDTQASIIDIDGGTVVLQEFTYANTVAIPENSATSALNIGNNSLCHFVSGSIDSFYAEFGGSPVAGVATVSPPTGKLIIHSGTFTNNSMSGTSSVVGDASYPPTVTLH